MWAQCFDYRNWIYISQSDDQHVGFCLSNGGQLRRPLILVACQLIGSPNTRSSPRLMFGQVCEHLPPQACRLVFSLRVSRYHRQTITKQMRLIATLLPFQPVALLVPWRLTLPFLCQTSRPPLSLACQPVCSAVHYFRRRLLLTSLSTFTNVFLSAIW